MALNRVPSAALVLAVAGCVTVRNIEPAEYIPKHNPAVVWVTRTNRSVVPVAVPVIKEGTLSGVWEGRQTPVAIPLSEIHSVSAKVRDRHRTMLLATTVTLAVISALYFGTTSH